MVQQQPTKILDILKGQILKWGKNNPEVYTSGRKRQLHREEAEVGLMEGLALPKGCQQINDKDNNKHESCGCGPVQMSLCSMWEVLSSVHSAIITTIAKQAEEWPEAECLH